MPIREAVGLFEAPDDLQSAIDDLSLAGVERRRLSVMAREKEMLRQRGWIPARIDDLRHDGELPRTSPVAAEELGNAQGIAIGFPAYVGAVVAGGALVATSGTALAAALAAALAGIGGAAAGSILSSWLGARHEEPIRQHLDKGGLLLWVNLDGSDDDLVLEILARSAVPPVSVHEIPTQREREGHEAPPHS